MQKKEADRKRKADEKKEARGHKKRKQQWWEEETDAGKARNADVDDDNAYYKEQVHLCRPLQEMKLLHIAKGRYSDVDLLAEAHRPNSS